MRPEEWVARYPKLKRFPAEPTSAWARNRLAGLQPELLMELLNKQPGHPAALAAAQTMEPDPKHGHQGALHLARWGALTLGKKI